MIIDQRPDPEDKAAFLKRINDFVAHLHYQHDFGAMPWELRDHIARAMSELLKISSWVQALKE